MIPTIVAFVVFDKLNWDLGAAARNLQLDRLVSVRRARSNKNWVWDCQGVPWNRRKGKPPAIAFVDDVEPDNGTQRWKQLCEFKEKCSGFAAIYHSSSNKKTDEQRCWLQGLGKELAWERKFSHTTGNSDFEAFVTLLLTAKPRFFLSRKSREVISEKRKTAIGRIRRELASASLPITGSVENTQSKSEAKCWYSFAQKAIGPCGRLRSRWQLDELVANVEGKLPGGVPPVGSPYQEGRLGDPEHERELVSATALLTFIFPEIRWVFGESVSDGMDDIPWLFDPRGSRRSSFPDGPYEDHLQLSAVVVEDELMFAYYHGYVAYRFGRTKVAVVTSRAGVSALKDLHPEDCPPDVLLEDLGLCFADDKEEDGKLADRDKGLYKHTSVADAGLRALITTGQGSDSIKEHRCHLGGKSEGKRSDLRHANGDIFSLAKASREKKKTGEKRWYTIQPKPVGDMFSLAEMLRLVTVKRPRRLRRWVGRVSRFVPAIQRDNRNGSDRHSAPGVIQAVAEAMLARVKRLERRDDFFSTMTCCVLATDALRLLRNRAPMLRFDALTAKHINEVRAELQFDALLATDDMEQRWDEICEDLEAIADGCQAENRHAVRLQAMATLAYRLMTILRNAAQYEGEMCCLRYLREAQGGLRRLPLPMPIGSGMFWRVVHSCRWWITWPWLCVIHFPRSYAEFLVSGELWRPLIFLALVPTVIAYVAGLPWPNVAAGFFEANANPAVEAAAAATAEGRFMASLGWLAIVLAGIFHIGVFISCVFSRIMRR